MEDSLHEGSTAAKESWADLTDRDPKCFSPSSHPRDGEERAFVNEILGGDDQGATETAGRRKMNAFGSPLGKIEDNDGTSGDHNGCKRSLTLERLIETRQIEVFCEFNRGNRQARDGMPLGRHASTTTVAALKADPSNSLLQAPPGLKSLVMALDPFGHVIHEFHDDRQCLQQALTTLQNELRLQVIYVHEGDMCEHTREGHGCRTKNCVRRNPGGCPQKMCHRRNCLKG